MSQRLVEILVDSFGKILIPGLTMTLPLTAISFCIALVIAVIVALVQFAKVKGLRQVARFYVWFVRGTPLLVQLFVVFYGLGQLGLVLEPFTAAVIVFSINEGAYAAETIRASLESIPSGQMEAGLSVGMTYLQTMRHIVLPQAMRTAFPPLSNSLISMMKDTSLVSNIKDSQYHLQHLCRSGGTVRRGGHWCGRSESDHRAAASGPHRCHPQRGGHLLRLYRGAS